MRQGNREKGSVTVDPHVYRVIERHAESARISKSRIVEDAIRLWERSRLAALAREGYQQMSDEDRQHDESRRASGSSSSLCARASGGDRQPRS